MASTDLYLLAGLQGGIPPLFPGKRALNIAEFQRAACEIRISPTVAPAFPVKELAMRIQDLLGRPIITIADGLRLGKVSGVEFDMKDGELRYLHFVPEGRRAVGVVPWKAVKSVGKDAITVDAANSAIDAIPATEQVMLTSQFGDRPVITEDGRKVGTIFSYEIDEATGTISCFFVSRPGLFGSKEIEIPYAMVRVFGRDAIVVANEAVEEKAA